MRGFGLTALVFALACSSPTTPLEPAQHEDPLWTPTATQPSVARADAPALLLPSGRVLVAGGNTAAGPTNAVELFNPTTESWQSGPMLPLASSGHVLALWEGQAVCVAGPRTDTLDPAAQGWSPLGAPLVSRTGAVGATLNDGRLVVVGGSPLPTDAERLEADGGWTGLNPSTAPHTGHTATVLANGTVEVMGGTTTTAETLDAVADTWSARAGPNVHGHTASLLPTGDLLLVGGDGGFSGAARFNPATGALTPVPGLRVIRASHSAATLPGGDVLVAGGDGPAAARSAERYIFVLDRFVASGCLDTPRARHASVVLADGGVVLVGGIGLDGGFLARSERLDFTQGLLAPGQPCAQDCECGTGFCADGVCCDQACQGACLACSVAQGAATDGTCALVGPSRICRAANGLCDADERCTGTDAGCPPDVLRDAGAVCRAVNGACDVPESCDGVSAQCPTDLFADAGVSCRGVMGVCDVPEVCTGTGSACPADRFVDAGVECRAAATGGCDVAEVCNGAAAACPADTFVDAGVVCRAASGGCDLAEVCSGAGPTCPADTVAFPGTTCRPAAGPCDLAEVCTGSKQCPADVVQDAGTMCRAANGLCDVADVCDGVLAACPDAFADAGVFCRAAIGACDLDDFCDGTQAACPDGVASHGTVCRPADAGCDAPEVCDGVAKSCPPDLIADAGVVCRAPSDDCDVAEVCTGLSAECPVDLIADAGTVCRAATGACDDVELCDGKKKSCPPDLLTVYGHPCRPLDGGCDVVEVYNGLNAECPPDGFKEAGTLCQASGCAIEGICSGSAAACPASDCGTVDAGPPPLQHYVGWNCACGEVSGAPWLALALLVGLRRRRFGKAPAQALVLVPLLFALPARADDAPVISDFSIRANASLLRDLLASQLGVEIGANVSLTPRFDLGASASLGHYIGGRLGVTWHLRDDGEWVRPFFQARAVLHSSPDGIAAGAGGWGGLFVPFGPGRVQAGALFEVYAGPRTYVPYDAFVTLGYELDIYRRIERQGEKPVVETPGPHVEPKPPPAVVTAEPIAIPAPAPTLVAPAPAPAPTPAEPTKVTTRVSLARDLVTFDERRANWDAKGEATVRKVSEVLKRYPNLKRVEIAGHADDGDSDAECIKISQRRADAVVKALIAAGIEPDRLVAKAYGNTKTKVPSKGPARKRELNRRVDFTILEQ
jgi:outer membrane protein OmpA-like peptidoglycan-associated protein